MDELYRPGYSFENAAIVKTAAPVRARPWFYQDTATGPLTAVSKNAPFFKDPVFHRYQPVWNRGAKQANASKIGAYFHDIPSFAELGQAPGPVAAPSVSRDPLGFLDNLISRGAETAGKIIGTVQKREEQKTASAFAQVQPYLSPSFVETAGDIWPWLLGAGAIGAILLLRR